MERISSDDPKIAAWGESVFEHLCHSLQLLAAPAHVQLSHFPARWVVLTDEMALDFDHWMQTLTTYWKPSREQLAHLRALDDLLMKMSTSSNQAVWTDEALSSDPMWEQVRTLAKTALLAFGQSIDVPPPAREERGVLLDKGSTFITKGSGGQTKENACRASPQQQ